jgi:NitT/TauT family transport system substrate-binding protein
LVTDKDIVATANLAGEDGQAAEGKKTFTEATDEDKTKEAISSKQVSISFRSGEYKLDPNAKTIIDLQFADIARTFSNARIRIEGNTDNVGNPESNKKLSYLRAQSVAQYLQEEYGFDQNRFVIIGNGSDKSIADNNTTTGKAQNRRTDFELIAK